MNPRSYIPVLIINSQITDHTYTHIDVHWEQNVCKRLRGPRTPEVQRPGKQESSQTCKVSDERLLVGTGWRVKPHS